MLRFRDSLIQAIIFMMFMSIMRWAFKISTYKDFTTMAGSFCGAIIGGVILLIPVFIFLAGYFYLRGKLT